MFHRLLDTRSGSFPSSNTPWEVYSTSSKCSFLNPCIPTYGVLLVGGVCFAELSYHDNDPSGEYYVECYSTGEEVSTLPLWLYIVYQFIIDNHPLGVYCGILCIYSIGNDHSIYRTFHSTAREVNTPFTVHVYTEHSIVSPHARDLLYMEVHWKSEHLLVVEYTPSRKCCFFDTPSKLFDTPSKLFDLVLHPLVEH